MNINYLFISFFTQEKLSLNNESIQKYCLDLKKNSKGRQATNYGGWQSDDIDQTVPVLKPLIDEIFLRHTFLRQVFGLKNEVKLKMGNYWLNINNKGDFNIPHVHPFSLASVVYYAKVPKDSGRLVFENPIQQHDYVMKPNTVEKFNTINSGYWNVTPNEGDLIIFPSWLRHWVEPNNTNEDRISIAFNLNIG